jgi:hypothetical protein
MFPEAMTSPPLRGLFRLQSHDETALEALIKSGAAIPLPDGWVLEDKPVYQFHMENRHVPTRYAATLREFFELVGPRPDGPQEVWPAFRGQVSEYLSAITPRWVSLQPGINRRERWPSELLNITELQAVWQEFPPSRPDPAGERRALERQYIKRRAEDPSDPFAGVISAIEPFMEKGRPLDLWLVEGILQHYGPATNSLDLSYDPSTSLFFALNEFQTREDGTVGYEPSSTPGVMYLFWLSTAAHANVDHHSLDQPWLDLDRDLTHDAVRPHSQRSIILRPHPATMPDGPLDDFLCGQQLMRRVIVSPAINAEMTPANNMPSQQELFPPPEQDPLYAALVDLPYIPLYA